MTRDTNQVTTLQAIIGACIVIGVAVSLIAGLDLLVRRGERRAPVGAPAPAGAEDICPDPPAAASRVPVAVAAEELIECPASYDTALVAYEGEAVRAILRRGSRAWLQLNDDRYALDLGPIHEHRTAVGGNSGIPVSVPTTVADAITSVGDARHHGDVIAVTGIFHRADPADGGGPTIQARTAEITRVGRPTTRAVDPARAVTAASVTVAALGVALLARPRVF